MNSNRVRPAAHSENCISEAPHDRRRTGQPDHPARSRGHATLDVEDIGVSEWHFHIDYRFLSQKHLRIGRDTDFRGRSIPFAYRNIITFEEKPETSIKWRKCRRLYPERYPVPEVRWMSALQQRYEGKQLTDDMKCPHRGASLVGLAPDADGWWKTRSTIRPPPIRITGRATRPRSKKSPTDLPFRTK